MNLIVSGFETDRLGWAVMVGDMDWDILGEVDEIFWVTVEEEMKVVGSTMSVGKRDSGWPRR